MMQSLQLLAWEQGIGMLWDSDETLYVPEFLDVLQMDGDERMLGILHFGYVEKIPRPRKRTDAVKKWREYPNMTE
nr:hypothetical protein [Paenibacillus senegalensis]